MKYDDNDKKSGMKNVKEISSLNNRYSTKPSEGKFFIERPTEDDAGNYSCLLPSGESKTINVVGMQFLKIVLLSVILTFLF